MLLYYYKPLYKPRADYSIVPGLVRSEKKRKKRKKTYEVIGTNSTALARESQTEEVKKWQELKRQAELELRDIRERISDLSARETARKKIEIQLAKEAKKLAALEAIKENIRRNIELKWQERRRRQEKEILLLAELASDV